HTRSKRDWSSDVCSSDLGTVFLATNDLPLVVDNEGAPPEGIDGGIVLREEIVGAHVWGDDVHVVVEGTSAALDFKDFVAGGRMGIGGAVDHFGPVHGEGTCIFGIGAFVGHHDAQATDLGIDDRPEGVEVPAITVYPP